MNGITILIWITIAIIGIIAIILVKLHYKGEELEHDEGSIIPSSDALNGILSQGKEMINSSSNSISSKTSQSSQPNKSLYGNRQPSAPEYDVYIVPEVEENNVTNYEYESENQILINYGNEVKKFQEPIKQSQMDIMTQNNKDDKTELKDLFTIDELIKESKRKDSEREKETKSREDDAELDEIKASIKKRQQSNVEDPLIEEVTSEGETIGDIVNEELETGIAHIIGKADEIVETEAPSTSQKDIEEVISSASKEESEEKIESISEEENITDVLLNSENDDIDIPNEEIKEPALKTPSKVGEKKDYEFGAEMDDEKVFGNNDMDLDYRKDLDKITNKITGSQIFQDISSTIKEKISTEEEISPRDDETYIRSVNEYDEFEPIINETHIDYENIHDNYEQRLRENNTRRVFNMAKNSQEPELAQPKVGDIKEKPARDNIKINLNNNEVVLKKGDEIIFNHLGETYSSQVYAINGDDISVRYRRKNITIKPQDVKKIY